MEKDFFWPIHFFIKIHSRHVSILYASGILDFLNLNGHLKFHLNFDPVKFFFTVMQLQKY